jgi:YVTN family beta-propeller protein
MKSRGRWELRTGGLPTAEGFTSRPIAIVVLVIGISLFYSPAAKAELPGEGSYLSPVVLAATPNAKEVFVGCATANCVLCINAGDHSKVATIPVPARPLGLVTSADGSQCYVTCAAPESKVIVIEIATHKIVNTIPAGHTAMSPVLSPDGMTLFVCNRFNNDVSEIDLNTGVEVRRIPVKREPTAATLTKDGKMLLVSNHLPDGRADADYVAACVSVVDVDAGSVIKELRLPNGSTEVNDIKVSPDGKYAVLTHIVAGFNRPSTHIFRGWMNANALTVIDVQKLEVRNTVLLDSFASGAANPWGVAWTKDSGTLIVTHAGTHDLSIIDFPALLAESKPIKETQPSTSASSFPYPDQQANPIPFLAGCRQRIRLPIGDKGPRSVIIVGNSVFVANYFSDTLAAFDLGTAKLQSLALAPKTAITVTRKGEFYFHDASLCLQGWQSCASCHPNGARADGLNWDLLNDGVGNPKNTKSLLFAHQTGPAMSLGVRKDAREAVRSGIKYILFSDQPEDVAHAIDAYLASLKPEPSPYLEHGIFAKEALRGKQVFVRAGCQECHPQGLFTDGLPHDVGTLAAFDNATNRFYTPTLVELWRTAPYFHDGSAVTVKEVVTTRNSHDQHGMTSDLSEADLNALCQYLLSL